MLKVKNNNFWSLENKKVKNEIKDLLDYKWIQKEVNKRVEEGTKLYYNNGYYFSVIDIIIPDRAGTNMEAELLERFHFDIDYKRYKNDRIDILKYIERCFFGIVDDLLNENINSPAKISIEYHNGDIVFLLQLDGDYIPPQAEKEYIKGTDKNLFCNITEGYISHFEDNIYLYSFWDYDKQEFNYYYIEDYEDQELLDIIFDFFQQELEDNTDYSFEKALDKLPLIEMLLAVPSLFYEFGCYGTAKTTIELFNEVI